MFRSAVGGFGIDPKSFWSMTPREYWLLSDHKTLERNAIVRGRGGLTESDKKELYDSLKEAQAND